MKHSSKPTGNKPFTWGLFRILPIIILFFVQIDLVTGQAYSNSVTFNISMENATVKKIFNEIEKQSEFIIAYNPNEINLNRKVTIKVENAGLEVVLKTVLDGTGLVYDISGKHIVLYKNKQDSGSNNRKAQQKVKITGTVTDAKGEPLIGANVLIKGTTIGTVTDIDGNYALTIPEGSETIQFSYIGYLTEEVAIAGQSVVNATLVVDMTSLDQVVVIGYGIQKKATITGSVVSTSGDEIKSTPVSSVNNMLVGRLPGLVALNINGEPGYDDSRILIRGKNTMGHSGALIVVDGVADREGGFSRIDVNDIESVSILKDASAAIYGSRAANGVILVTTKRGSKGAPKVNYSFNYGLKKPTILPELCNSAEFATILNEIDTLINSGNGIYSDEEIELFRDGSDPIGHPNANYFDAALKDGFSPKTQHSLTLNAGNDIVKYFGSLGYQFEDNYYKNSASNYQQFNFRSNVDVNITDYLDMGANVSVRQENRNSPYYGSETIWRYLSKADPRVPYVEYGTDNPLLIQDLFNPITAVNGDMGYQHDKRIFVNADILYDLNLKFITQGLSLNGQISLDQGNTFYKNWFNSFYLYEWDNQAEEYVPELQGTTSLYENYYRNSSYTANIRLNYDRNFGKNTIKAFVGYEQFENRYDNFNARRLGYISTAIDELGAGEAENQTNDGYSDEGGRVNYFGRFDYDFADKYIMQFNFRYDGSENFAKGHRFGFFPGISIGWRASEEEFWKNNIDFIDYFKLRASVGQIGDDILIYNGTRQSFGYLTSYELQTQNAVSSDGTIVTGSAVRLLANRNLRWETATIYNAGVDGKLMNSSLDFSFDYFKTYRVDILGKPTNTVPDYAGLYSGGNDIIPYVNMNKCEANGFEFSLDYNKVVGQFRLGIGGNISYSTNKITFSDEAQEIEYKKEEGKPIDADWILYEAIGIFRTEEQLDSLPKLSGTDLGDLIFRDVDTNGVINADDKVRQTKTSTPEIIYGIHCDLQYKQWQLSMLWQGAGRVWQYVFRESGTEGNFTKDYYDNRSTPANNYSGKYPRVYDRTSSEVGQGNTFWLQDASYLRLKNIELSYTLPQNFVKVLPMSNLRVYVNAYNLLTFTGLKDLDPETVAGDQNFTGWSTPQAKVINIGFNVTF